CSLDVLDVTPCRRLVHAASLLLRLERNRELIIALTEPVKDPGHALENLREVILQLVALLVPALFELPRRIAQFVTPIRVADRRLELVRAAHRALELRNDAGQARLDFTELCVRDVD